MSNLDDLDEAARKPKRGDSDSYAVAHCDLPLCFGIRHLVRVEKGCAA